MPKPEEITYVCPTHGPTKQIRHSLDQIVYCAACGKVMQPEDSPRKA